MRWGTSVGVAFVYIAAKQRTPLRQYLEHMPVCALHRVKHLVQKLSRDLFVEEITHGIYEHSTWSTPMQWLFQLVRSQREVEAVRKWMIRRAAESLCYSLGIAVIAAGANLRATADRVP